MPHWREEYTPGRNVSHATGSATLRAHMNQASDFGHPAPRQIGWPRRIVSSLLICGGILMALGTLAAALVSP